MVWQPQKKMVDEKAQLPTEKNKNKFRQKQAEEYPWLSQPRWGGKSVWDWISLLPVPIFTAWITAQVAIHTSNKQIEISTRQNEIFEQREQVQENRNQQALLNEYQKDISRLAEQQLLAKEDGFEVIKTSARAKTLNVLEALDGKRKGKLIQYLADAQLIEVDNPIINLGRANLSDADLKTTSLIRADLSNTLLSDSNFWGANLIEADLSGAILVKANFEKATLEGANFKEADIEGTNFTGARKIAPVQIKSACNWNKATFSDEFKKKLDREADQKVNCDMWNIFE